MKKFIVILDLIVSFFVLLVVFALIVFMASKLRVIFSLAFENPLEQPVAEVSILHAIAFAVVLIKAYSILISYLRMHHISIKYMVEIAIIAPAIEVIFNAPAESLSLNILYTCFSLVSLVLYLLFYERLVKADQEVQEDKWEQFSSHFRKK